MFFKNFMLGNEINPTLNLEIKINPTLNLEIKILIQVWNILKIVKNISHHLLQRMLFINPQKKNSS